VATPNTSAITSASPNTMEAVLPTHAIFAATVLSIFSALLPCFGRERAFTAPPGVLASCTSIMFAIWVKRIP